MGTKVSTYGVVLLLTVSGNALAGGHAQLTTDIRFAAVGDFNDDANTLAVASLIAGKNPDVVITTGDNNYSTGNTSGWDAQVGKYYGQYIGYPSGSSSAYAPGPSINAFFPSLGNHDHDAGIASWYTYFDLPGNERYYDVVLGPVHFFFIDSDSREPDGITSTSTQAQWLQAGLAAATEPWKIVAFHHPPYTSGVDHGPATALQWPFQTWGATAVLNGHNHQYERIMKNGFPYIVTGAGGKPLYNFKASPDPQSVVRYNGSYGASIVDATPSSITFAFYSINQSHGANGLIDSFTIGAAPIQLTSFTGDQVAPDMVRLQWTTLTETNNHGFEVQKSSDSTTGFTSIPNSFVQGNGTTLLDHQYSFIDSNAGGSGQYYRLKQMTFEGTETFSQQIRVVTVGVAPSTLPHSTALGQNFPNPFNPVTTIGYTVGGVRDQGSGVSGVRLAVYDILGREIAVPVNEPQRPGTYAIRFDASNLASGIYSYRLEAGGVVDVKKMVVVK